MKFKFFLIIIFFLLTACATPYQKFFLMGGYTSQPVEGNYLKVSFFGNNCISQNRVREYVLLRIAEIGKQRDKKYFIMYQTMTDIAMDKKAIEPVVNNNFNVPKAYAYVRYSNKHQNGDLSVNAIYEKYAKLYIKKH